MLVFVWLEYKHVELFWQMLAILGGQSWNMMLELVDCEEDVVVATVLRVVVVKVDVLGRPVDANMLQNIPL